MRRRHLALLLLAVACKSEPERFARAVEIESLDRAIGGPAAAARKGDFLLENDRIRAVIEQAGTSRAPLGFGGSLVDLDLVRTERRFAGGRGLDQLEQIAPTANLYVGGAARGPEVRISRSANGAEITAASAAAPIQKVLAAFNLLLERTFVGANADYDEFYIYNEYELRPGESVLRIVTTVGFDVPFCRARAADGCGELCDDLLYDDDCTCDVLPERCGVAEVVTADALPDRAEPAGISDVMLGDLPRPLGTGQCADDDDCNEGELCTDVTSALGGDFAVCRGPNQRNAGVLLGDMLLFGGHLKPFLPRVGFDAASDVRRLFDVGKDTLSQPLRTDLVLAIGDRVSYGFAPPRGTIMIPIFGGPFSMGATAGASCRRDDRGCLRGKLVRTERLVSVGEGDATTAMRPLLAARGTTTRSIVGTVTGRPSGAAIADAEVYALRDPRDLPCDDACLRRCPTPAAQPSLDALLAANRCRTISEDFLDGVAEIGGMARTDVGTDPVRDGRFTLDVPPGRWFLVAVRPDGTRSAPSPIEVGGASISTALVVPDPGLLKVDVLGDDGRPIAARVTIGQCLPRSSCVDDADCRDGLQCRGGACACERTVARPLELGGAEAADGVVTMIQTADGRTETRLPPGRYELVVSRGPHHTIDRGEVVVESGRIASFSARVAKQVDDIGYVAADFHVHAEASADSSAPFEDRITSFLAEDMDVLSSSDHDVYSDYAPLLVEMGEADRLRSMVGVEVSTQELGHFIGFPLDYRVWRDGERVPGNGAQQWREQLPQAIFDTLRSNAAPGERAVVDVPHPFSYFGAFRIDPVTIEPTGSIITLFNDLVREENFSGDFDAMELLNAKAFDTLRRPTVGEIRFFSRGFDELLRRRSAGAIDEGEFFRRFYNLSTETTRRMLHRTASEQDAARTGEGIDVACRCGASGDCASGLVCDDVTMTCVPNTETSSTGVPPPDDALCRSAAGVVDDWFNMLDRGVRKTGVGGSDVHATVHGFHEAGSPRTLVRTGDATAPSTKQIVDGVLAHEVVVTNGPMIHLEVGGGAPGAVVTSDGEVEVRLRVERATWYDVDRIELYRNRALIRSWDGCASRRRGDAPCLDPEDGVVVLDETFTDRPDRDAWYVAIAMGLDGRTLSPVYASAALPRFGTLELTQRIYDIIPALRGLRFPKNPSLFPAFPFAITNPVWVDLDGDGWTPPLAPPSWCRPSTDFGCD